MKFGRIFKSRFRKLTCIGLSGIMCASLAASSLLALAESKQTASASDRFDTVNFENVTGKMDLSSVTLQNLSPSVLENAGFVTKDTEATVIVTLDSSCIIDYLSDGGSVSEYLSSYSGRKNLKNINVTQTNFLNSLASLGVSYKLRYQYTTVTNAVAIDVNTKYLSAIKGLPAVKSAVVSETYAFPEDAGVSESGETVNGNNVYKTGIYDSSAYLDKYDGSGMTVAILDTGLDYTHEAFSTMPETVGMTKNDVAQKVAEGNLKATGFPSTSNVSVNDLYINDKVPYAYDYADKDTDVYPAYSQHGPHVAGIVAGHAPSYKNKDGDTVYKTDAEGNVIYEVDESGNEVPVCEEFNGVAPNAQLVICKVFTDDFDSSDLGGAKAEDIIAALEDCVTLGVDVINMSLGSSAGFSTLYIDGDDEGIALATIYDKVRASGISLICAASNDYSSGYGSAYGTNLATSPDSGTVGSPSTFSGALSVGSINGQQAPYVVANDGSVVYYLESSDENGNANNFLNDMLGNAREGTFKYVVVPGYGRSSDYTTAITNALADKSQGGKAIAVVMRGGNTFKEKVQIAKDKGADAIIIYNNVAGSIRMSLGDLEDPIPAISVTMDSGNRLCYSESGSRISTGTIKMNTSFLAGPFMNDYSSWGTTSDLKLKPEITSHGGEITSTVSGGYEEMSGTSMASPNMAGVVALIRGKLAAEHPDYTPQQLNSLVNQIVMSTAETVYDENHLPYSPRKQGAGLATLDNLFNTNAYLYTVEDETKYTISGVHKPSYYVEDGRPKIELGDGSEGAYNLTFHVRVTGDSPLTFKTQSIFFTETLASNGLSVAERAHLLNGNARWTVNGQSVDEGGTFTVAAGGNATINVTLTLSSSEKNYITSNFPNGMFVEGFLKLLTEDTDAQICDLTLPFMGFYGDWTAAPMLDYDAFEIAAFEQDASYTDETRPQAQVWATQAYAKYYLDRYIVPLGSYTYTQDENAVKIYADQDHAAVSCFDIYNGIDAEGNYLTTTSVKTLYAGLLRNAEIVTYDVYNDETGEVILSDKTFRRSKAYASGGSAIPANIELNLDPVELGLTNNGKYRIDFHFYFYADDVNNPEKQNDDNTYSMTFYVDYESPVLENARIRYYDYKENNVSRQRVYLDLDIYDNHYAQAVVLCYMNKDDDGVNRLYLATEYVTPIYNAVKNGTTTVSIDITDFYIKYQNRLYIQIDDYALNHSVYTLSFASSDKAGVPDTFSVAGDTDITLGKNQTYQVALEYEGTANLSNFTWDSNNPNVAMVNKKGEIFAAGVGTATITVTGINAVQCKITVHVVDSDTRLTVPSISFGVIENSERSLVKAAGSVKVNAGKTFELTVEVDPWYYPITNYPVVWSSENEKIASVDANGVVTTHNTKGTATIIATVMNGTSKLCDCSVTLNVQEPATVSGGTLSSYNGSEEIVTLPLDKNIIIIGETAFKDNNTMRVLILPYTVTTIRERAFQNCTALEEVYFAKYDGITDKEEFFGKDEEVVKLALIYKNAFDGCTSLKKVDFSNTKVVTLDSGVFKDCTKLSEVDGMEHIGNMYAGAFEGCTSLTSADITGLHNTGSGIFKNCTNLREVKTAYFTSIGERIFEGCIRLESVTINTPVVMDGAFMGCSNLKTVTFGSGLNEIEIGDYAFYDCFRLNTVDFNGSGVLSIGSYAFADCEALTNIELPDGVLTGVNAFAGSPAGIEGDEYKGAIYSGTTLVRAPENITADFEIREGTTAIAPYAFAGISVEYNSNLKQYVNVFRSSKFADNYTLVIPDTVIEIGSYAFYGCNLKSVRLFENLVTIGEGAFERTSLTQATIPASVTTIGAYAFADCRSLAEVTFAGSRGQALSLGEAAFAASKITTIALPNLKADEKGVVRLAYAVFANCGALTSVDLANVNVIGESAFDGCSSLTAINLKDVTKVEAYSFYGCEKLATVTGLDKLTDIGDFAFAYCPVSDVNIGSAVVIGICSFYGNTAVTQVTIPECTKSIGYGAFANSPKIASFTVNNNSKYFAENGVLYAVISEGEYTLLAYPAAKAAPVTDRKKIYTIKEGTVTVEAYSFNGATGAIDEVVIPYSVKIIGDRAFFESGIKSYVFESINAPTLLSSVYDISEYIGLYTLYSANFEYELVSLASTDTVSPLSISYPTNGNGYDNYIYSHAFGSVNLLGELMDDTTRNLINAIDALMTAEEVTSWAATLSTSSASDTQKVIDFAEAVKSAHEIYNSITDEVQLGYLGEENVQKLFDIETALKPVKQKFNIVASVKSLSVSADSTHKTSYKPGENFDMTGLKLVITYDDYSTETVDSSVIELAPGYNRPLTTLDHYITLSYNGNFVEVEVTVSNDEPKPPEPEPQPEPEGGCGGCGSTSIGGGGSGGFIALGAVLAVLVTSVIIRKRKANH